jgi:hypothetical protein
MVVGFTTFCAISAHFNSYLSLCFSKFSQNNDDGLGVGLIDYRLYLVLANKSNFLFLFLYKYLIITKLFLILVPN